VFPSGSVYCATKHAIVAFSEGLRKELSPKFNIKVTCIEPGVVATGLINTISDESLKRFVENTKKLNSLKPEDVAKVILFAVEAPSHMNVNELMVRPTTQEV
jgi:NADP-dependent 3-hydroxy acid dehydrogenase YdfG